MKTLKVADPSRYQPEHGADYPRSAVRPGAAADRAAHESGRRPRGRVRRRRRLGHARQPGLGAGPARHAARRLLAQHRRARHRPRRAHGRHRRADDVGVRPGGERERQSRHRSRPRQRDDGHRRRRARRPGLRHVARAGARASATKDATSRSRPTSATSSARSSCATWASPTRSRSSRATPSQAGEVSRALRADTTINAEFAETQSLRFVSLRALRSLRLNVVIQSRRNG